MGMVTTEVSGPVLVVRVDDGKANALTRQAIGEIIAAVERAESDDGIRAIALLGRPGRFSGGFNHSVMPAGDIWAISALLIDSGDVHR